MNYVPIEKLLVEETKKLKKLTPWKSTYKSPVARKLFDEETMAPLKYGLVNRNPFRYTGGGGGGSAEVQKEEEQKEEEQKEKGGEGVGVGAWDGTFDDGEAFEEAPRE